MVLPESESRLRRHGRAELPTRETTPEEEEARALGEDAPLALPAGPRAGRPARRRLRRLPRLHPHLPGPRARVVERVGVGGVRGPPALGLRFGRQDDEHRSLAGGPPRGRRSVPDAGRPGARPGRARPRAARGPRARGAVGAAGRGGVRGIPHPARRRRARPSLDVRAGRSARRGADEGPARRGRAGRPARGRGRPRAGGPRHRRARARPGPRRRPARPSSSRGASAAGSCRATSSASSTTRPSTPCGTRARPSPRRGSRIPDGRQLRTRLDRPPCDA